MLTSEELAQHHATKAALSRTIDTMLDEMDYLAAMISGQEEQIHRMQDEINAMMRRVRDDRETRRDIVAAYETLLKAHTAIEERINAHPASL